MEKEPVKRILIPGKMGLFISVIFLLIAYLILGFGPEEAKALFDPSGWGIVLGIAIGLGVASVGPDSLGQGLRLILRSSVGNADEAKLVRDVSQILCVGSIVGGFAAFLIGLMNMLSASPMEYLSWMFGLAVAIETILYGLILFGSFYAQKLAAVRALESFEKEERA